VSKIVRHEFVGNWLWVFLLCLTGIGIPIALLHLFYTTVRIETEVDNPEDLVYRYRTNKLAVR
jgi:hypothetical protein